MAEHHIELIRRGYESWNSGDRQWVLDHMRTDVEWVSPPDDPDPGTYHGYEGVQRFWANWRELFGQLQFEIEDIEDLGDHVLVVARRLGVGNVSGIRVEERVIQIFSFDEDDRCYRVQEFYDRAAALAAAAPEAGKSRGAG